MKSYEYNEALHSKKEGYVFALFPMENATLDILRAQISSEVDSDCLTSLQAMRIKKNLGSRIHAVIPAATGYRVTYDNGDICDTATN